ncbi:hypothetical protein FIBSPDRAFT_1037121 [Athelia psychrophila]|uniref:G domain-containing protein n=1 Tax=Athelia psychrophila TaxID=1759441 RepID=A0A166UT66_9AGAM|nr:hypothetical protein FIBSPDRAFT_1037121 [Fibularhizoctonia sp. CBS 109695]
MRKREAEIQAGKEAKKRRDREHAEHLAQVKAERQALAEEERKEVVAEAVRKQEAETRVAKKAEEKRNREHVEHIVQVEAEKKAQAAIRYKEMAAEAQAAKEPRKKRDREHAGHIAQVKTERNAQNERERVELAAQPARKQEAEIQAAKEAEKQREIKNAELMPPVKAARKAAVQPTLTFSSKDRIVVLMGPTGSGKSTFIEYATGQSDSPIGHSLEAQTDRSRAVRCMHPRDGGSVILVDTPGLDNPYKTDIEVVIEIADFLQKLCKQKVHISTIIYLHRVSDKRMTGEDPLKNLKMLTSMCGQATMPRIALSTTMWSEVRPETGARQEQALARYWTELSSKECHLERFGDSVESAWAIIGNMHRKNNTMLSNKTVAEVEQDLSTFLLGQQELSQKLEQQAARQKDPELAEEIEQQRVEVENQIGVVNQLLQQLRSFSRRLRAILSSMLQKRKPQKRVPGNDIFIVVMGLTGTGKSSFINMAAGSTSSSVSDGLGSTTDDIQEHICGHPHDSGRSVVFIDTPGIGGKYKTAMDVLWAISGWLTDEYEGNVLLTGILFIHRITDNRAPSGETAHMRTPLLNALCGGSDLRNVVLVTTMCDEVGKATVTKRVADLQENFWKPMIAHGSRIDSSYRRTLASAWGILNQFEGSARDLPA